MISMRLCLLTIFFFLNFINCAEIEYDCFFKNFVKNVFDKDFKYFSITNFKGKKVQIQDNEILEDAKILFEEIGPKITVMVQSIKQGLDDRSMPPKTVNDNLQNLIDLINSSRTKNSKKKYLKTLKKALKLIDICLFDRNLRIQAYDLVPNHFQEAILDVGKKLALFYEINRNIEYYINYNENSSFLCVFYKLQKPITKFTRSILKEYEAYLNFIDYMKIYKSTMFKAIKNLKKVLEKEKEKVSKMKIRVFNNKNDMLGETLDLLYKLKEYNERFGTLLNDVFDASEEILKILEDQAEEFKPPKKTLSK